MTRFERSARAHDGGRYAPGSCFRVIGGAVTAWHAGESAPPGGAE